MRVQSLLALKILVAVSSMALARDPIRLDLKVDGVQRTALIFSPTSKSAAPVIFAFHGHGGNAGLAARGMDFQDAWPEALVVYMQGLPTPSLLTGDEQGTRPGWQHHPGELGDRDLKFFDAVLASLHEKYSIDDRRIYATGFSNGGFFAYLLWAERPKIFAAIAPGAALILSSAPPTEPCPVLHFGGEADPLVKFAKQEQTISEAKKVNGCSEQGQPCGPNCTLYESTKGAPVETFIHPGGHFFPPAARDLIVNFFKAHPQHS